MATILQKHSSKARIDRYANVLDQAMAALLVGKQVGETDLVTYAGLEGKIVTGNTDMSPKKFSDDAKSEVFIDMALRTAVKCPICGGFLDTVKSVSYDHIIRAKDGGSAKAMNIQLTHPYCNQSVKN